ncbi:MAG: ribose-phosphate pyrophosphokinase [Bacteroidota bacterium]
MIIFAGSGSSRLTKKICEYLNVQQGQCQLIRFSEGTLFVQIDENIRGKDVYIIQSTSNPANDNFMELLFMIDACKRANAKTVTPIIPYFSYAKGDKMDDARVSIRARVCADAIESTGADHVVFLDLHAQQIQGFFSIPVDNLHALPILSKSLREKRIKNPVIVSPDVGFIKQARLFAKALDCSLVIVYKERVAHDENAKVINILGDVNGKTAIIVDDFIASGGTLIEAAENLINRGALSVWASVTHGLFTKNAKERIQNSPIEHIIVTDSVETESQPVSDKIQIVSIAPLVGEVIRRIHNGDSISELSCTP